MSPGDASRLPPPEGSPPPPSANPPQATPPQATPPQATPPQAEPPKAEQSAAPPQATSSQTPPQAEPPKAERSDAPPQAEQGAAPPLATPPQATSSQAPPQAGVGPPGPKMVRRVVVSYRLGWLPGDWLQTWRRLDRLFARAELKVKATLAPLEDLPADTDILVVPPDLREAAREAAVPGTPILVTPPSAAAGAFADLVSRLQAGTEFTAEQLDPEDKDKPKIVSYRGHTLID